MEGVLSNGYEVSKKAPLIPNSLQQTVLVPRPSLTRYILEDEYILCKRWSGYENSNKRNL